MSREQRRYVLEQGIGSGLINVLINAAVAWLLFRSLPNVPLWGLQSIAGDTVGTCFVLPFATCLIVTRLTHREVRRGRFPSPDWRRAAHPALGRLPGATTPRAALLGLLCTLVVAPLALGALAALGIAELGLASFVAFKALFAGALAAVVTPLIAVAALGDTAAPGAT